MKRKPIACIYAITNLVNGKRYIGSTVDFVSRRRNHLWSLRLGKHSNAILQRSFNKHGEASFATGIISKIELDSDLLQSEQIWIDSYGPEYNIAMSTSAPMLGRKATTETKRKMSEAQTGRKMSDEARKNISKARTGIKLSDEHRKNLSISHTGNRQSSETKAKLSAANKGKIFSAETRRKISIANRGPRKFPPTDRKEYKKQWRAMRRAKGLRAS